MEEINEEIKQTLNLMQADIDDGAHDELQYHLACLLEIKRNELQPRLVERSWLEPVTHDQAPYKSVKLDGQIADEAKPLTVSKLMAGGWWCADTSKDCANAFETKGLRVFNWGVGDTLGFSSSDDHGIVTSGFFDASNNKQIHRIGNDFYWSEKWQASNNLEELK